VVHIAIKGVSAGNNIVRNNVSDEGGRGVPPKTGVCAKKRIVSCTEASEQKNILVNPF